MNDVKKAIQFLKEAKGEMKKVTWPDRDEVTSYTGVVVVAVVIISVFLWFVDTSLMSLVKMVLK